MSNYIDVLTAINSFLVSKNNLEPFSERLFQGIFIKKMSNSNLISSKKYTIISTGKKTHQSHIDLTGQDTLTFFFGDTPSSDYEYTQIMLDIPVDNLTLLNSIDNPTTIVESRGRNNEPCNVLKRSIPSNYSFHSTTNLFHYAYAFKKLDGHYGEQNQINRLQNKDAFFELCSRAYENDLLIFMKHSLNHYICILVPTEYSSDLLNLMDGNINFSVINPAFDNQKAVDDFCEIMSKNVEREFTEIEQVINSQNSINGQEKDQLVKTRVGQGAFRKLLIEQRGCSCELCNVNIPEVLRASHIQSWASSNPQERMDLQNGLLLCANHDALFDRHMISFDPTNSELLISTSIDNAQRIELKLNSPKTISMSERMKTYMKKHKLLFES